MKSMIAVAVVALVAFVAADVSELTGGPSNQYLPPNQGGQGGFGRQGGCCGQSPQGQGFGGQDQGFGSPGRQGFGQQGFGQQGPQGQGFGPQGFSGQGPRGQQGFGGQGPRGQQGFGGRSGFGPERDYLPPTQNGEPAPAHTFGEDGYKYRNPNQLNQF